MALNKAEILSRSELPTKEVPVPEWGGSVIVKTMTGAERDSYEAEMFTYTAEAGVVHNRKNTRARLLVRCLVDDKGARLFEDADSDMVGNLSAKALDRLFGVAQKLNGFTKADVDELEKN